MKKIFIIILSAIICGAVAFGCCELLIKKHYSARGTIMVTVGNEDNYITDSSDAAANSLLSTVKDLLLSADEIYHQLSNQLDGKYSANELKSFVSITRREDNYLYWDIEFKMSDAETAKMVTNAFLELAPKYIRSYIPNSYTRIVDENNHTE